MTYACLDNNEEPQSYSQAINSVNGKYWQRAIDEEIKSLNENRRWNIVDDCENERKLTTKWIFKLKNYENGKIIRYKARLVVRGCSQRSGINYNETYSPVM